jgi:hypothetical protein
VDEAALSQWGLLCQRKEKKERRLIDDRYPRFAIGYGNRMWLFSDTCFDESG